MIYCRKPIKDILKLFYTSTLDDSAHWVTKKKLQTLQNSGRVFDSV